MGIRDKHLFQFSAKKIAEAAMKQARWHREREAHWRAEFARALEIVKSTASLDVIETPVTNGVDVDFSVKFGDPEAHSLMKTAAWKARTHSEDAARFETDARVYSTQGERVYELSTDDVHYYGLGGHPRDDVI